MCDLERGVLPCLGEEEEGGGDAQAMIGILPCLGRGGGEEEVCGAQAVMGILFLGVLRCCE